MGFDAGSITGYLKLDSSDFDDKLDKAQERAKKVEDSPITVKIEMPLEEFDADADEAQAKKDRLEQPIDIPAKIDNAELAASALESEAIIDALKENAADVGKGSSGLLSLNPGNIEQEARQVKALIADISTSASAAASGDGLVQMMLGSGASQDDLMSGLQSLGFGKGEARSMISAAQLVDAIMPSSDSIAEAARARITEGIYQLTSGPSDPISSLYSILAGEKTIAGGPFTSGGTGGPLALPSGLGNLALGADGQQLALGPGSLLGQSTDDLAAQMRAAASDERTARLKISDGGAALAAAMRNAGTDIKDIADYFGVDVGQASALISRGMADASRGFSDAAGRATIDLTNLGDDVKFHGAGFTTNLVGATEYLKNIASEKNGPGYMSKMWSAVQGFTNGLNGAINKIPGVGGGVAGLSTEIPIAGALGLAGGGALAGTAIGTAGTLWAAIPGLIDLLHGYAAYQATQTLATTKNGPAGSSANAAYLQAQAAVQGTSPGSMAIGKALGPLIGGGASLLGGLEGEINPQIVTFLKSLTVAMGSVAPFAQKAVGSMGKFFSVIDKGMESGGFKKFMGQMTKDVGPIMDEFGTFFINTGKTFGDFLEIFGGKPAQMVGKWFDDETGKLDTFLAHAKISPGFMKGAKLVFHDLGLAINLAWDATKKLFQGLEPIGGAILKAAGPVLTFTDRVVKMLPKSVITTLGIAALGFYALGKAVAAATAIMDVDPIFLIITAVALLALGIFELATHWHQVWGDIKNWTGDAVNFLRSHLYILLSIPIIGWILAIALNWSKLWTDAKNIAETVWKFLENDVFHPIGDFFVHTFGPVLKVAGEAWDAMWHGVQKTLQAVWSVIGPIIKAVTSAISTITGGIGGLIHAGGSVLSSVGGFLTGHAVGGGFTGNSAIMVGENGPEVMYPKAAGFVTPNNRLNVGGPGNSQGLTIYIDATGQPNQAATRSAVASGINTMLPRLRAAMERGSGQLVGA